MNRSLLLVAATALAAPSIAHANVTLLAWKPALVTKDMAHTGKVTTGAAWRDNAGDNIVFFTEDRYARKHRTTVRLYAYHFVTKDGVTSATRKPINDGSDDCEDDNVTALAPDSIRVGDLDGNGVGEISFGYGVGCTREPIPYAFKFLVLEGGTKYILRGETHTAEGLGGKFTADPAEKQWPSRHLVFAKSEWKRLVMH